MTDYVSLTIKLTAEQHERVQVAAHERGYETPDDYVLALIEADGEANEEDDVEYIKDVLRQGIREALTKAPGMPIDEFLAQLREKNAKDE